MSTVDPGDAYWANETASEVLSDHLVHTSKNGVDTDPLRNFKFLVKFDHVGVDGAPVGFTLGFTSVSGLSMSTNSIPYRQGGMNTTAQMIPGQTSFTPVTLQRGVLIGTRQNWDWMRQLFAVNVGSANGVGSSASTYRDFRGTVRIFVLQHPVTDGSAHNAPIRFQLNNAWPTSISYSDLNAGDNAFLVEQMVLVHEGFDVGWS